LGRPEYSAIAFTGAERAALKMSNDRPGRGGWIALAAFVWAFVVLASYYSLNIEYYRTQLSAFAGYLGL